MIPIRLRSVEYLWWLCMYVHTYVRTCIHNQLCTHHIPALVCAHLKLLVHCLHPLLAGTLLLGLHHHLLLLDPGLKFVTVSEHPELANGVLEPLPPLSSSLEQFAVALIEGLLPRYHTAVLAAKGH